MTMYVRVRRQPQTVFLYTDSSEKIADLKAKYAKIIEKSAANEIQFRRDEKSALEEDKTVGELKIENDNLIYAVFKKGDGWEDVVADPPKPKEGKD